MKKYTYSLLAAAAACGFAAAETAYTTPVGYITESINVGFNFISPTVHESIVAAGSFEVVTATTAQDTSVGVNFETSLGTSGGSGTYVLEIENADGTIQEVTTWTTDTLNVADLTGISAPVNYKIRKAATVASVFGADNSAGLSAGGGSSVGADQVWVWNGAGWDKYYYDLFAPPTFAAPGWVSLDSAAAVNPEAINLIYADGFGLVSAAGNDLVVAGEVKPSATEITLQTGFNFVGSVVPVGATLATAFGANNESGLNSGGGSSVGADQVWLFNGAGWDKYYFDQFAPPTFAAPGWVNLDTATAVDPATVDLPSGFAINAASAVSVTQGVPAAYNDL